MHVKRISNLIWKGGGSTPSVGTNYYGMKKYLKIRKNSVVVFDKDSIPSEVYAMYYAEKFEGKTFIFLGEIPNCKGHCFLADLSTGLITGMWHTINFREATEDEC